VIRHLVLFSVRDVADLPTIRRTLTGLAEIGSVRAFELGEDRGHDEHSDRVDLVVHAVFDDEAGLAAFKADERYHASTAVVRPLRELRVATDYEVADDRSPLLDPPSAPAE
jgi:Fe2+ or Zn2+ uptake regulation protein